MKVYVQTRKQWQKTEGWWFFTTWLVLTASYVLKPDGWQAVTLPGGQLIPSFSLTHYFTKLPGPTCGLTRSFVNMAHFNLGDAFRAHFLGPALFGFTLGAAFYYTYRMLGGRKHIALSWSQRDKKIGSVLGLAFVGAAWAAKLVFGSY